MSLDKLQQDWSRYVMVRARFQRASQVVANEVETIAKSAGIPCRVSGREKSPSEFLKKALRKQDKGYLEDPWGRITDKAGARAIVQLEGQIDQLAAAIEATGTLPLADQPQDSRKGDPQQLDYTGLHLQVFAPPGLDDAERIECELQLRTEAQDLWSSVVSHRFLYKPLVKIPDEIKRSLYRLVALIELFDEEVERAMNTIRKLEGYELYELLDLSERVFLSLSPSPDYDQSLSLQMLSALSPSIPEAELATYPEKLAAFAEERREDLQAVYDQYGPQAGEVDLRYLLLSQPESVVVLERLTNATGSIEDAWRDAGLPDALLTAVAGVWAVDLSDTD
jgi:ppGpp synthetase/RelA/SpoT-type nucleotidyltranferase